MIEFLLLFALGFLTAALLALVVAPVVHRRIVTLTERRVRASTPLSAAEIRAEKDLARAAYAAENARLAVDLRDNRDRLSQELTRNRHLEEHLAAAREEAMALGQAVEQARLDAGALRSTIRERETEIDNLNAALNDSRRQGKALEREIEDLDHRINRLSVTMEEQRIDIATRDTEIENFMVQLQALRDERASLREDLRNRTAATRELEIRLKREETRAAQLDEKLAKAVADLSDREQLLERRDGEIARLKDKQKQMAEEARAAAKELRQARKANANGAQKPGRKAGPADKPQAADAAPTPPRDPAGLAEQLRARQAALSERLLKADTNVNDQALRREIAEVAAMMIELTALREGDASPIRGMLAANEPPHDAAADPSLAERAATRLGVRHPR